MLYTVRELSPSVNVCVCVCVCVCVREGGEGDTDIEGITVLSEQPLHLLLHLWRVHKLRRRDKRSEAGEVEREKRCTFLVVIFLKRRLFTFFSGGVTGVERRNITSPGYISTWSYQ